MTTETWKFTLPVIAISLVIESYHSLKENKSPYEKNDTICSIVLGVGGLLSGFFCKIAVLHLYVFVHHYKLCAVDNSWLTWMLAVVASDFSYYWFHRSAHEINWFWLSHATHHSSVKFNLSTALRLPWTSQLTGGPLFWIWMPFVGFDPAMVIVTSQLVHFYQFWIHTEAIKKLPIVIEYIFNTPSHHRVHHSSDLHYMDKNHGGILIVWDRIFGTFKKEDGTLTYGLMGKPCNNNPVYVVFSSWHELIVKAINCGSFVNAFKYFVLPPGWSHDGTSKTVKQLLRE